MSVLHLWPARAWVDFFGNHADIAGVVESTTKEYQDMLGIKTSPWGRIQDIKSFGIGIDFVGTASHGGFKLDSKRNAQVPEPFRNKNGWYEEDCEAAFVIMSFPELFSDEQVKSAHRSAKNWYPERYERHFGVVIPLEESCEKRSIAFDEQNHGNFVVRSAWGDWHDNVPKGMVGVYAKCQKTGEEKYFLVGGEEYKDRNAHGFVIDLERHQEVDPIDGCKAAKYDGIIESFRKGGQS